MDVDHRTGRSRGRLGLLAGVVIVCASAYGLAMKYVACPPPDSARSAAFLSRVAASINPLFPRKIDEATEITRVSALEGVFIYHYRFVNVAVSQVDAGVLAALRPAVTKSSCANAATLNNFIKKDIILRYLYSDKAGRALAAFDVTRADCGV